MTRMLCALAGIALLPIAAAAQDLPPAPPPLPVAPIEVPLPVQIPEPLPAPMPPLPDGPSPVQVQRLEDLQAQIAREIEGHVSRDQMRLLSEQARLAAEQARMMMDEQRVLTRTSDEGGLYNAALNALQRRQYDQAVTQFDRVLALKGPHADAAMYWKAFSLARLVRTDDALASLTALRRDYPTSRYLGEAKVLEADIRELAGQPVDPQTLDANDELKLIAINGIANTDPDRAIPLLEGVLNAANTLGNKRRALFVLALSDDPRAHDILLRYARGAGSPELQIEAIRNLASRQDRPGTSSDLRSIYMAEQDPAIRRAIIDAYGSAGDKTALIGVIVSKDEKTEIKRSAIGRLAGLAAPADLWSLYQQEPDADLRRQMTSVLASMGAVEQLTQIARTDQDAAVRLHALRVLGSQSTDQAGSVLVALYGSQSDTAARRVIISALQRQGNAAALVTIARRESDLDLKRMIVSALSAMAPRNKAAADYLVEVIR